MSKHNELKLGITINLQSKIYDKLVVSSKGYCLYAYLKEYSLPKVCLNKGNGVIDCFPCYYIRTDNKYLPTLIFVIRNIKGVDAVVLMKDNNDLYNQSRLLYTIDLEEFIVRFNAVKEVSSINMTCAFNFPAKYEPYLNDEISDIVNKLPKHISQFHIEISDKTFLQPHWYSICCWKSKRGYTHEPNTYINNEAVIRDKANDLLNDLESEIISTKQPKQSFYQTKFVGDNRRYQKSWQTGFSPSTDLIENITLATRTEATLPSINYSDITRSVQASKDAIKQSLPASKDTINPPNKYRQNEVATQISPIRDISPMRYSNRNTQSELNPREILFSDSITPTELEPFSLNDSSIKHSTRNHIRRRNKSEAKKTNNETDSSIIYPV